MRSIRLSLILYFLVLFAAALGGVAYLSYQSTQQALAANTTKLLAAKQASVNSTRKLWEEQFNQSVNREDREFDAKLLVQAKNIAGSKIVWHRHRIEALYALGILGNVGHDFAYLTAILPWAQAGKSEFARQMNVAKGPDLRIQHPEDEDPEPVVLRTQYFQTYLTNGYPLEASDTLDGLRWKLSNTARDKAEEGQPYFDEVELKPGHMVRRVTLKATASWTRRGVLVGGSFKGGPKGFGGPKDDGTDTPLKGFKPSLYFQFGKDKAPRDQKVAQLRADLNDNLKRLNSELDDARSQLREELEEARADLRNQLLWVGIGVFVAVVVGGFVVVRLTLLPLNRVSDAVSMVSEKDFRLAVDERRLPSELKPIVVRLCGTLEQLKRAFDREKQAAADISHELRTPVAALLTTLSVTLRKPRSVEEYREVLQDLQESGQQISQLVERLLTLARLDAGADLLRTRDVDATALADQCVALVRPLAEARGLHVDVHHAGATCLRADPDKLREVLTNLLHNAIEYNRPNGSVALRVERNNGHLDMEVRDTGIGMTPEVRRHIFERFFRADPSRQSDGPHAGLGLAIVKGYVDLMGGSIQVDSIPGAGSTFLVRLPVAAGTDLSL